MALRQSEAPADRRDDVISLLTDAPDGLSDAALADGLGGASAGVRPATVNALCRRMAGEGLIERVGSRPIRNRMAASPPDGPVTGAATVATSAEAATAEAGDPPSTDTATEPTTADASPPTRSRKKANGRAVARTDAAPATTNGATPANGATPTDGAVATHSPPPVRTAETAETASGADTAAATHDADTSGAPPAPAPDPEPAATARSSDPAPATEDVGSQAGGAAAAAKTERADGATRAGTAGKASTGKASTGKASTGKARTGSKATAAQKAAPATATEPTGTPTATTKTSSTSKNGATGKTTAAGRTTATGKTTATGTTTATGKTTATGTTTPAGQTVGKAAKKTRRANVDQEAPVDTSTVAPPVDEVPTPVPDIAQAWSRTVNVQAAVASWLTGRGGTIRTATPDGSGPARDLVVSLDGDEVHVEVTGWPPDGARTHPTTIAGDWFAAAEHAARTRRREHPHARIVIALPDTRRYRALRARRADALAGGQVEVWFVGPGGAVEGVRG